MAEINNEHKKPGKQHGINKKSTRVDLTPMVDLGFLLITFFVFTSQLSLPTTMHINMPYDKVKANDEVCESCALTLLLQKDDQIGYYEGIPSANTVARQTDFAHIRSILLDKKRRAAAMPVTGSTSAVLIIKAAASSSFQNYVDILDEATINAIPHYYLSETDAMDSLIFKHIE